MAIQLTIQCARLNADDSHQLFSSFYRLQTQHCSRSSGLCKYGGKFPTWADTFAYDLSEQVIELQVFKEQDGNSELIGGCEISLRTQGSQWLELYNHQGAWVGHVKVLLVPRQRQPQFSNHVG